MIKIYGSEMCPDCLECKANFDDYNIEYEFIDINESLSNLSAFLKLRDTYPRFDHCKEIGDIGLPTLIFEDGTLDLDWDGYLKKLGKEVTTHYEEGHACNLSDRKGC